MFFFNYYFVYGNLLCRASYNIRRQMAVLPLSKQLNKWEVLDNKPQT